MELSDLRMYNYLCNVDSSLANQVQDVYNLVFETINSISKSFSNYTMHDMNHGLRVATYMEQLAFGINGDYEIRISQFSPFEITLMILSSILHDIGMTIREEDIEQIKNSSTIKYTKSLTYQGVLKVCNNDEEEAIKEIIRRTHAARIEEFMTYEFGVNKTKICDKLAIEGKYYYSDDIVTICKSHGEDYSFLKKIRNNGTKANYQYNSQYIAALLRIADYLDIDQQRTPMLWYSSMGINGFSKEEWEKHFVIQNTTKLKKYIDNKLQIYFDGKSSNAKIHRKYLAYIDEIKNELENADELLNTTVTPEKYKFNVSTKIDDLVCTEGFTYSDLRLNLDYSSITNLLMGKNIYGDSKLGLRELIQNSIDACKLMKELYDDDDDLSYREPAIQVSCSKNNNYVKIRDTGVGMTLDIVKKHFLNVGKSYYKSDDFKFKSSQYQPIGQYGIGFLACFLLSNNVTVKTKYYNQAEVSQIELEKNSEYVVTTSQATPNFIGTEITLDYDKFMESFESFENIEKFLCLYFNTEIEITLTDVDESKRVRIKNQQLDIIKEELKKGTEKYYPIDLGDYSDNISGSIFLKYEENIKAIELEKLDNANIQNYFYDKTRSTIIKCDDLSIFEGKYRLIEYPNISNDEMTGIFEKNEDSYQAYLEAVALAKNRGDLINIFFDIEDSRVFYIGYFDREDEESKRIEDLFHKSNLNYFKELFIFHSFIKTVFIHNSTCSQLSVAFFDDRLYYRSNYYKGIHDAVLYHKGIYVPHCAGICIYTPYDIKEVIGVINCEKIPLKLDVSRNTIIDGEEALNSEINVIVLMYINNNLAISDNEKVFLNAMIESIEKETNLD
jgi:hypothetical protein